MMTSTVSQTTPNYGIVKPKKVIITPSMFENMTSIQQANLLKSKGRAITKSVRNNSGIYVYKLFSYYILQVVEDNEIEYSVISLEQAKILSEQLFTDF